MARSTKTSKKKSSSTYLCFDLGGTKLLGALINSQGRVLHHASKPVNLSGGLKSLLTDFREVTAMLPESRYKAVSVASAGPLHSERGVLLDPTNFFTDGKSWGVVPLVGHLRRLYKKPVWLENDAAAAVLAEAWKGGHGKRSRNVVAITLGTGVGIGVVANGELVRAGQGLHPEASHIPINAEDQAYPCGCGAYGCIEANLGGTHFARRVSLALSTTGVIAAGTELDGHQVLELARTGNADVLAAFRDYGQRLALAIRSLCVLFAPETVVLSGGFSKASEFFLPSTEEHLPELMVRYREGVDLLPKISLSRLGDLAGALGAARVALDK